MGRDLAIRLPIHHSRHPNRPAFLPRRSPPIQAGFALAAHKDSDAFRGEINGGREASGRATLSGLLGSSCGEMMIETMRWKNSKSTIGRGGI